jgi:hypothetical protein
MTDLRALLDTVAGEPALPTPDVVSSDLRRGRTALRRRRRLQATAGLVLAGAALAVGVAVVPDIEHLTAPPLLVVPGGSSSQSGVRLVLSAPDTSAGPFNPSVVPEGWTIYSDNYELVISAPGMTSSPDDFEGKLVVTLLKKPHPPTRAQPVAVSYNNVDATTWREGNATVVLLRLPDDPIPLEVRAPESLGWSMDTLLTFVMGVQTNEDAVPSDG